MWLFTTDGYYSIVQDDYCQSDEVVIRVRIEEDLKKLLDEMQLDTQIINIQHADYKYRVIVKKEKLKEFMHNYIDKLDYPNFKNAVKDARRKEYYGEIWYNLYCMGNDL